MHLTFVLRVSHAYHGHAVVISDRRDRSRLACFSLTRLTMRVRFNVAEKAFRYRDTFVHRDFDIGAVLLTSYVRGALIEVIIESSNPLCYSDR